MSILEITKTKDCQECPRINELEYGTFITGVPAGKDCVYVKVKKKGKIDGHCHSKKALFMLWESGYCVLLNLTYGTLRQIPGDTQVTPLKPCLTVAPLPRHRFNDVRRECYK